MIYNPLNEKTELFTIVSNSKKIFGEDICLPSGNIFESIARTNPEMIDKIKMLNLKNSDNFVKDFNKYFSGLMSSMKDEYLKFEKDHPNSDDKGSSDWDYFYKLNQTYYSAFTRSYDVLKYGYGLSDQELNRILNSMWLPDSNEDGIRKMIELRIMYNRSLTDSLIKMIKNNYNSLMISEAEAYKLVNELNDDKTNNKGIKHIKEILDNPKTLEKFKIKNSSNYDFRSIGGAVCFFSDDPSIQFSYYPSKKMSLIFDYDAIVMAHGYYVDAGIHELISSKDSILNEIYTDIEKLKSFSKKNSEILKYTDRLYKNLKAISNLPNKISLSKIVDMREQIEFQLEYFIDTYNLNKKSIECLYRILDNIDFLYSNIKAKSNPLQAVKDGKAYKWYIQPIDTLTTKNNIRVIDVIRTLKKEGFKNIYVGACNPGSILLPADIKIDRKFKVTYGTASVFLESNNYEFSYNNFTSIYKYYTISELYNEIDNLCNTYPINESLYTFIPNIVNKCIVILKEIWKRVLQMIELVNKKIDSFINKNFKNKSKKLNKDIDISIMSIVDDRAAINTFSANSPSAIATAVKNANNSIYRFAISTFENNIN